MQGYTPDELATVFRALEQAGWDSVLVGGQAVNIWATQYHRDDPAWRALLPYTSRDLDYHGGLAEARLAMRALKAQGQLNTEGDPSPNAGVLKVSMPDGRELIVDILTGVYGVSAAEVERTAVTWSGVGALSGLNLRVIHPLLLLEAKLAAWRGLPQAGRQDDKHVKILIRVVREWLREQLKHSRVVFRALERLAACAASPDGVHAFVRGADLLQALPLEEMRAVRDFETFFQQRWPQLLTKISRKRERHMTAVGDEKRRKTEQGT